RARALSGVPHGAVRRDGGIVRIRGLARRHPFVDLHVDVVVDRGPRRHGKRCGDERDHHESFRAHNVLQMLRIVIPVAAFLISLPFAAEAFKEGPYPNVTGGFGEQSCHLCHNDNPTNAPGGTLMMTGVPPAYVAGETYAITVSLAREGMRRGGFEIAA